MKVGLVKCRRHLRHLVVFILPSPLWHTKAKKKNKQQNPLQKSKSFQRSQIRKIPALLVAFVIFALAKTTPTATSSLTMTNTPLGCSKTIFPASKLVSLVTHASAMNPPPLVGWMIAPARLYGRMDGGCFVTRRNSVRVRKTRSCRVGGIVGERSKLLCAHRWWFPLQHQSHCSFRSWSAPKRNTLRLLLHATSHPFNTEEDNSSSFKHNDDEKDYDGCHYHHRSLSTLEGAVGDSISTIANVDDVSESQYLTLQELEDRVFTLNGGRKFNLSSPREVATVLFGDDDSEYEIEHNPSGAKRRAKTATTRRRSTNRTALEAFIRDCSERSCDDVQEEDDVDSVTVSFHGDKCRGAISTRNRKEIAELVLRWRSLRSKVVRGSGETNSDRRYRQRRRVSTSSLSSSSSSSSSSSKHKTMKNPDKKVLRGARGGKGPPIATTLRGKDDHKRPTITTSASTSSSTSFRFFPSSPKSYERMVESLFEPSPPLTLSSSLSSSPSDVSSPKSQCQMDQFWKPILLRGITKPFARAMVRQLDTFGCPMGYDPNASASGPTGASESVASDRTTVTTNNNSGSSQGRKGTLLWQVREQKRRHPSSIVLVRVGEFYEAYGLDAILLVQHCGLNPMGGKARAGCPARNIQQTLNGLTLRGFTVAVYEEMDATALTSGRGVKSKLKNRVLTQIVSPSSPTYMHDLVLNDDNNDLGCMTSGTGGGDDVDDPSPRPHVGVIHESSGYTLVEVSWEERTARVSERLTAEAVSCRLAAYPPSDPLFYIPTPSEYSRGGTKRRRLPFLPATWEWNESGVPSLAGIKGVRVKMLNPETSVEHPRPGLADSERAKRAILSAILRTMEVASTEEEKGDGDGKEGLENRSSALPTREDFSLVSSSPLSSVPSSSSIHRRCAPLHRETATQLGLMSDPSIPSLVDSLLPSYASASSRKFLRRWLLIPPPASVTRAMSMLVSSLRDDDVGAAIPPLHVTPVGKVTSLVRAGQSSARVYREIAGALVSTVVVFDTYGDDSEGHDKHTSTSGRTGIVGPLLTLVEHESGISADGAPHVDVCNSNSRTNLTGSAQTLRNRCAAAAEMIESVVRTNPSDVERDVISDFGDVIIPRAFFERNEASWRGRVHQNSHCRAEEAYRAVEDAAAELVNVVARDFWGAQRDFDVKEQMDSQSPGFAVEASPFVPQTSTKNNVVHDIFNNILALRMEPSWAAPALETVATSRYHHPRDRNGKILRNRYTTDSVERALSGYVGACEEARNAVADALKDLSKMLCKMGHLPTIVQACHANLILATASLHSARSNEAGWTMAERVDNVVMNCGDGRVEGEGEGEGEGGDDLGSSDAIAAGRFVGVWPYWMDRSSSVPNTFTLDGIILLTAPNMSGKSTLMRSAAASALLTICGLCCPMRHGSWMRPFDSIFVRGASADVPSEHRSAFGAEMSDVASLLRSCGRHSLVFFDELGRGTSPRDGTAIAGAVLETIAFRGMSGFFATHLHGLLELPLNKEAGKRIVRKRMAVNVDDVLHRRDDDVDEDDDDDDALETRLRSRHGYGWTYRMEDGVCTDSLALITAERFGLPVEVLDRAESLSRVIGDIRVLANSNGRGESLAKLLSDDTHRTFSDKCQVTNDTISNNNVVFAPTAPSSFTTTPVGGRRLSSIAKIAERILGKNEVEAGTGVRAVHIPPRWSPPPSLEGCTCVYVLEIKQQRSDDGKDFAQGEGGGESGKDHFRYYVGETECLSRRLSQHRAKGVEWMEAGAIAVRTEGGGKSHARNVESLLIRSLSKLGYDMISVSDGSRVMRSPEIRSPLS